MTCDDFGRWLDDLLVREPGEIPPDDAARHLAECAECARQHALALETVTALTPAIRLAASAGLKERILAALPSEASLNGRAEASPVLRMSDEPREGRAADGGGSPRRRARRAGLLVALAAGVLLAIGLFPLGVGPARLSNGRALGLLAEASAAEARLFAAEGPVALVNEIVVAPVDDAGLVEARWLPLVAIGADGKPRYEQLKLGGEPGRGYTVRDQAWYDPATRRFARVLSTGGRPLFALAFDGRALHRLEVDGQGRPRVTSEPVAGDFRAPANPAAFLGIAAGLTVSFDRPDRRDLVRDEGPTKLADGSTGRVVRLLSVPEGTTKGADGYVRATIRDADHTLASLELVAGGRTLYTVRLAKLGERREPEYGWDLAGLRPAAEPGGAKPPVQALANLIVPDITVDDMARRADFPTYVFAKDPSWAAGRRRIMDMLDLPSPPHRMFALAYPAQDQRHVVLVQARSFNDNLGPKARAGRLVYTSPGGVKVWNGEQDQALGQILLSSTRGWLLGGPPARDRTAYLLETPDGTVPALAVNGALTDAELHELVDSLVPARPK